MAKPGSEAYKSYQRAYRAARSELEGRPLTTEQRNNLNAHKRKGFFKDIGKKRLPIGPEQAPIERVPAAMQTHVPGGTRAGEEGGTGDARPRQAPANGSHGAAAHGAAVQQDGEVESQVETALPEIPHARPLPPVDFSISSQPVATPTTPTSGEAAKPTQAQVEKELGFALSDLNLDLAGMMRDFMKGLAENARAGGFRAPPDAWFDGPYYKCCQFAERTWMPDLDAKKTAVVVIVGTSGATVVQSIRSDNKHKKEGKKSPVQQKLEKMEQAESGKSSAPPETTAPPVTRAAQRGEFDHLLGGKV